MSLLIAGLTFASLGAKQVSLSPISYTLFKTGSAKYHMVTADVKSGRVAMETVRSNSLTSVWNLLRRGKPKAAITGTFFNPRSGFPVADILVDGKCTNAGSRGTCVGIDYFGGVSIFDVGFSRKVDWSLYRFGLRGAVRVIENGSVKPNPKAQRFRDAKLWGRASRTAVGLTKQGKVVFVATQSKVTLSEIGKAMKAKGVREAVCLDGGGSTCLYYGGSLVVPPSRKLSNMLLLSEKSPY